MKTKIITASLWICFTLNLGAQQFNGYAINAYNGAPLYVYGDVTVKINNVSTSQELIQTMQRVNTELRIHSDRVLAEATASRVQLLINEQNYLLNKISGK